MIGGIDFAFLIRAIEENENITIRYELSETRILTYLSRFFEINKQEKYIVIDLPTPTKDAYQALSMNDPIAVYFKSSGFRFRFLSFIGERIYYALHENNRVEAIKIPIPHELQDANRRDYFRVRVSENNPLCLHSVKLDENQNTDDFSAGQALDGQFQFYEAVMIDISEGGIALKTKVALDLKKDDKLLIWFDLDDSDEEPVVVEGIVRNTRQYSETDNHLWGVEFIPKKDLRFKKSLRKIQKFIMKIQRNLLAQRKY